MLCWCWELCCLSQPFLALSSLLTLAVYVVSLRLCLLLGALSPRCSSALCSNTSKSKAKNSSSALGSGSLQWSHLVMHREDAGCASCCSRTSFLNHYFVVHICSPFWIYISAMFTKVRIYIKQDIISFANLLEPVPYLTSINIHLNRTLGKHKIYIFFNFIFPLSYYFEFHPMIWVGIKLFDPDSDLGPFGPKLPAEWQHCGSWESVSNT